MAARRDSPPNDPPAAVDVRLYGPLNDFLPPARRGTTIHQRLAGSPAVKDVVEAIGVPHPEVELVVVNGEPVGLEHRLRAGDRVAVYPAFRTIDLGPLPRAGPPALPGDAVRFVLDGHLGRLAAYLRMCGFDTAYRRDADDEALAGLAAGEERILLTRDLGLLKRGVVRRGAFVRADRPPDQLVEVLDRFDLGAAVRPFTRCLRCNGLLEPVEREAARDAVPPRVFREQPEFRRCPACGGIYWRGSHHARMTGILERALGLTNGSGRAARGGPPWQAGRRPAVSEETAPPEEIGTITHWFGHLSVAAIRLTAPLAVGERIRIRGHVTDLVETVLSMEVEHQKVERAQPGDDVALAVEGHVRVHDHIFREP